MSLANDAALCHLEQAREPLLAILKIDHDSRTHFGTLTYNERAVDSVGHPTGDGRDIVMSRSELAWTIRRDRHSEISRDSRGGNRDPTPLAVPRGWITGRRRVRRVLGPFVRVVINRSSADSSYSNHIRPIRSTDVVDGAWRNAGDAAPILVATVDSVVEDGVERAASAKELARVAR
jgi:hypothetical protein